MNQKIIEKIEQPIVQVNNLILEEESPLVSVQCDTPAQEASDSKTDSVSKETNQLNSPMVGGDQVIDSEVARFN